MNCIISNQQKKTILVIGATGAMGRPIVQQLLSDPLYHVRAFTRNSKSEFAVQLAAAGAEVVEGSSDDRSSLEAAMKDCYGVFANTDFWSAGEEQEIKQGKLIFEVAQEANVQHFLYAGIDYLHKLGGFQDKYRCPHFDGKAKVEEWILEKINTKQTSMNCTMINTAVYMENLASSFLPFKDHNGVLTFAVPLGNTPLIMVALDDIAWFVKHVFDHPDEYRNKVFDIASDEMTMHDIVKKFTEVTGIPAQYYDIDIETCLDAIERSLKTKTTIDEDIRSDMRGFINGLRDGLIRRDITYLRKIHPELLTFENWMKKTNYRGEPQLVQKLYAKQ